MTDDLHINTVYIISKGRPQCRTARTLMRLDYPGAWYIVCGNNDDTIPQYIENWGADRVIIFDWYDEITRTDTMDNFGFKDRPSGACPVRNATRRISEQRGELRHWQFDDDYLGFSRWNHAKNKNEPIRDGAVLEWEMYKIAKFGHECRMNNVGFILDTMEAHPDARGKVSSRVFNAHNLPSTADLFEPWRGRMEDDAINAIDIWRHGGYEISLHHLHVQIAPTQSEKGGMTDLYKKQGTAQKTAYAILAAPGATTLVYRFRRYHHNISWRLLRPKLIDDKWLREDGDPLPAPPETDDAKRKELADKWRRALLHQIKKEE